MTVNVTKNAENLKAIIAEMRSELEWLKRNRRGRSILPKPIPFDADGVANGFDLPVGCEPFMVTNGGLVMTEGVGEAWEPIDLGGRWRVQFAVTPAQYNSILIYCVEAQHVTGV